MFRANDPDPTILAIGTRKDAKRVSEKVSAGQNRTCANCGARLNMYKQGDLCSSCMQKQRDKDAETSCLADELEQLTERHQREKREQVERERRAKERLEKRTTT